MINPTAYEYKNVASALRAKVLECGQLTLDIKGFLLLLNEITSFCSFNITDFDKLDNEGLKNIQNYILNILQIYADEFHQKIIIDKERISILIEHTSDEQKRPIDLYDKTNETQLSP